MRTNISESKRNRPAEYPDTEPERTTQATAAIEYVRQLVATGTPPADIAATVVDAIHKQRFYVLPHPQALSGVRQRMEDILKDRSPVLASMGAVADRSLTRLASHIFSKLAPVASNMTRISQIIHVTWIVGTSCIIAVWRKARPGSWRTNDSCPYSSTSPASVVGNSRQRSSPAAFARVTSSR